MPGDQGLADTAPDFDALYRSDPDPWEVGSSWYEERKMLLLLGCLRRSRYHLAWDAACGTGHLAAALAPRCDRVLATDASATAVALAASRTAGHPQVRVARSALPGLPEPWRPAYGQGPDLIVLSEVLYYLTPQERTGTYDAVVGALAPGGEVAGVHWRATAEHYLLPGAAAHLELGEALTERGLRRVVTLTDEEFLIGVWGRD